MIRTVLRNTRLIPLLLRWHSLSNIKSAKDILQAANGLLAKVQDTPSEHAPSKKIATELLTLFQSKYASRYKPSSEDDLISLVDLVCTFNLVDPKLWELLEQLIQNHDTILSIPGKITILQRLRLSLRYNNKLFTFLTRQLLVYLSKMDIDELVQTTLAYLYYNYKDSKTTTRIEDLLVKYIGEIYPPDFCVLLDELAYNGVEMPEFLEAGEDYVFKKHAEFPKNGLCGIVSAYTKYLPGKSIRVLQLIEEEILGYIDRFTVNEIVDLLALYSTEKYESKELFETFESFIAKNFSFVPSEDIATILLSFANLKQHQCKLFILFYAKIKSSLSELSVKHMGQIVEAYTKIDTKDPQIYDLIEPHLMHKVDKLDKDDVLAVVYGYSNQNIVGRFKLYDYLEGVVQKYKGKYSVDELVQIAYGYVLAQKGRRGFVSGLLQEVMNNIEKVGRKGILQMMAITAREHLGSDICGMVTTQLYRYFDDFAEEELKEIVFLANKHKEEYKDIRQSVCEKLNEPSLNTHLSPDNNDQV